MTDSLRERKLLAKMLGAYVHMIVPRNLEEMVALLAAHDEQVALEARIDELEIKRSDYEDMLKRTWLGLDKSVPKFWIEAELGVLDEEVEQQRKKLEGLRGK